MVASKQYGGAVELSQASRRQGLYIIGANGTGKTGLIEHLILQDIDQGLGVGLLDPHGDLTNAILTKMTKREDDVILLDIQDEDHPFGLNIFECSNPQSPTAVQKIVDLVMHIFEKLYDVSRQTPRMAQFLRNCTHTLVANPGYTMADIPLLLQDDQCRSKLVAQVKDPQVQLFWKTYNALRPSEQFDRAESTLNKMDELLQPLPRNIVGQGKTTVNIQQVMDERKILLVKLSAQLDQVTSLVGTLIIALFLNAAYSRASLPVNKRKQFNLYADEFQRFATEDFATLLTEARKFGIATTIAHQARYQPGMTDGIRAVSLQAANHVVFRVTSPDADELAGGFDVSPQAAWEEEIEKEWVEVLKAEWYERVEEEVIDGEEEILVPQQKPLKHLLTNGHKNHQINTFVNQWARNYGGTNADQSGLNSLFYEAMISRRGDLPIPFSSIFEFAPSGKFKDLLTKAPRQYIEFILSAADIRTAVQIYRQVLLDTITNTDYQRGKKELFDKLEEYRKERIINLLQMRSAWHPNYLESTYGIDYLLYYLSWLHEEPITTQQFQQLQATYEYGVRLDDLDKPTVWFYNSRSRKLWYTQQDIQNRLGYQSNLQKYTQELSNFENSLIQLRNVLMLLAQEDNWVKVGSGQRQPRKRKQINYHTHPAQTIVHPRKVIMHPQRAYQDVKNDIANQLSGLSNFTARVKLSEIVSHNPGKKCLSCKLLNNPGAKFCSKCGTKLPAPNEYTITTLKPLGGLGKAALQQRLATIQGNNRQIGYIQDRSKVEAEITKRQTDCSGGSAPAQPQQPQQQQQAKHARQVPVPGHCPTCNATNPRGSKFCNNCGTRLP